MQIDPEDVRVSGRKMEKLRREQARAILRLPAQNTLDLVMALSLEATQLLGCPNFEKDAVSWREPGGSCPEKTISRESLSAAV